MVNLIMPRPDKDKKVDTRSLELTRKEAIILAGFLEEYKGFGGNSQLWDYSPESYLGDIYDKLVKLYKIQW